MSIESILRKLEHGPRRLPACGNGEGPVTVPGVGAFALVSVGNTAYTTGIDVFFRPEGDEDAARGYLRYVAAIDADYRVSWKLVHHDLDYGDYEGRRFGAAVWETAAQLVETLHLRSQVSWGFHVSDAAEMQARECERRHRELSGTVADLKLMLAGRVKHSRTPESLRDQLARAEPRLARMEETWLPRIAALKGVTAAFRQWCVKDSPTRGQPIHDILTDVLDRAREPVTEEALAPTI